MKTKILFVTILVLIIQSISFSQDPGGLLCGPEPKNERPIWILRFEIIDKYSHTQIPYAGIKIFGTSEEHEMFCNADSRGIAVFVISDERCIPWEATIEITASEYHYYNDKLERNALEQGTEDRRIILEGHTHQWVHLDMLPSTEELINKIIARRYRVGYKTIPSGFGFDWPNFAPALFEYQIELERITDNPHHSRNHNNYLENLPLDSQTYYPTESRILFNDPEVQLSGILSIIENDAIYDSYYTQPPHWEIIHIGGSITFSFPGQQTFYFHALGSTIEGISYCYIDIYLNGEKLLANKFINENWTTYSVPATEFLPRENQISIVLTGETHIWFDEVWIER